MILALIGACGGDDEAGDPDAGASGPDAGGGDAVAARAAFWEAFYGGQYARLDEVIPALTRAAEADPSDAESALLLGHAHLWRVVEWGQGSAAPPADLPASAGAALAMFERVAELDPDDHRVLGWRGAMRFILGVAGGDADLIAAGEADIALGVERHPEFNLFSLATTRWDLPASDPRFAEAPEALWDALAACVGEPIAREGFDYVARYAHLETTTGPRRVCWNGEKAPHSLEGVLFHLGELTVKSGDAALARAIFEDVQTSRDYPVWPFRELLEERLASDLEARAALFSDADPGNDPPISFPNGCMLCHQR